MMGGLEILATKKFAINGIGFAKTLTGMERYLTEITQELDKICADMDVALVLPKNIKCPLKLKNIKIVNYGSLKGELWGQICFTAYLYRQQATAIEFGSRISLLKPNGIVCLHDIKNTTHKKYVTLSTRYFSILKNFMVCKFAKHVITVSEYSKQEIIKKYHVRPDKITIAYNGWQHMGKIKDNDEIFTRFSFLKKGEYFFTLGSLAIHKNIKWIIENAKNNPNDIYVLSGKVNKHQYGNSDELTSLQNVRYVGHLSDEDMKSLMRHCKALVMPSLFEGFGIPPLEALSLGSKAIVSKITCLPEIFEDCVSYIDPYDSSVDLDELLHETVAPPDKLLKKYSWEESARIWYTTMKGIM